MKVTGEISVSAPPQVVFEEMQQPATLQRAIPNCESIESVGDDAYSVVIDERVAGVSLELEVDIEITALREPEYVEISLDGEALGSNTGAEGTGTFELSPSEHGGTDIAYSMDISVSGKLASLGFKMLTHVVNQRIEQMADNIEEIFE